MAQWGNNNKKHTGSLIHGWQAQLTNSHILPFGGAADYILLLIIVILLNCFKKKKFNALIHSDHNIYGA